MNVFSPGLATCNAAILLDDTLTTPPYRKSGYQLNYQPQGAPIPNPPAACANAGFNAYLTTAVPVVVGQTGQTSYCSEEPGDHSLRPYRRTSGFASGLHRASLSSITHVIELIKMNAKQIEVAVPLICCSSRARRGTNRKQS